MKNCTVRIYTHEAGHTLFIDITRNLAAFNRDGNVQMVDAALARTAIRNHRWSFTGTTRVRRDLTTKEVAA